MIEADCSAINEYLNRLLVAAAYKFQRIIV